MKNAPNTLASGSVRSAVRMHDTPAAMAAARSRMRQRNSSGTSSRVSPLNGSSTSPAKAKRDHATKNGSTPPAVISLPAVSPITTQVTAAKTSRMTRTSSDRGIAVLAAPDKWHLGRHQRHELYIRLGGQLGHVQHRAPDLGHVHRGRRVAGVGGDDPFQQIGARVADVDLPTGDVIGAAIEAERLGQPGYGMFRGGIGNRPFARRMR